MSIYDDDGFDEEAAELSEAITGSYTGSGGGQQTGFSFDDGGDSGVNVTLGSSGPRGTSITGNVIRGGTIFGRTQNQLDRQQRLSGMGDYRNSEAYQRYKTETGRSLQNPYGNTGLFSGIFGADRVNYNMDPAQAQNILDIGFDRYMNFDQQPEYAQSRGFGKLFGSPEGEMTVQGELRAQVPETTTAESLLSSIIPGASFLPTPGTTYVPMGTVDFQPDTGYDPKRDPRANQDLRSGPFSLLTDALSKGRDFIASKLSPAEELAAQTQTQARGPELSQTVSGGRFEDDSAKNRAPTQGPPEVFVTDRSSVRTFDPNAPNVPVEAISGTVDFPGTILDKDFDNVLVAKGTTMSPSQFQKAQDFKRSQPDQEVLTFGGDIQDSLRQSQNKDNPFIEQGLVNPRKVATVGSDPLPATLSAGDFVLPSGEVINTNRSSFSGSILKDIIDGNLFETDFLGGQLKFSPEFDLKRGLTGGNIQFKKRF